MTLPNTLTIESSTGPISLTRVFGYNHNKPASPHEHLFYVEKHNNDVTRCIYVGNERPCLLLRFDEYNSNRYLYEKDALSYALAEEITKITSIISSDMYLRPRRRVNHSELSKEEISKLILNVADGKTAVDVYFKINRVQSISLDDVVSMKALSFFRTLISEAIGDVVKTSHTSTHRCVTLVIELIKREAHDSGLGLSHGFFELNTHVIFTIPEYVENLNIKPEDYPTHARKKSYARAIPTSRGGVLWHPMFGPRPDGFSDLKLKVQDIDVAAFYPKPFGTAEYQFAQPEQARGESAPDVHYPPEEVRQFFSDRGLTLSILSVDNMSCIGTVPEKVVKDFMRDNHIATTPDSFSICGKSDTDAIEDIEWAKKRARLLIRGEDSTHC